MKHIYTIGFLLAFGSLQAQTPELGDSVGMHVTSCFKSQWDVGVKASVPGWELSDSLFRGVYAHSWQVEMMVVVDEFGDVINTNIRLSSLDRQEELMLEKEVKKQMKFKRKESGRPPEETKGVIQFLISIEE